MSHVARAHAKLAPSAAHRWIPCPGSVRLCAPIPDKGSVFADEGTAAHMLAEHCLESGIDADRFQGMFVNIRGRDPATKFVQESEQVVTSPSCFGVDDEMVAGVQLYLDYVRDLFDKSDFYAIEQRCDLTHLHPEIWGTGDAVAYQELIEHLHVIDFKYGRGVAVEPEKNDQELCYASGSVRKCIQSGRKVRRITLHIVQPRALHPKGPIRLWTTTLTGLRDFEKVLKGAAEATENPNAPLKAGEHCRFCPAAALCPERKRASLAAAQIEFADDGKMAAPAVTSLTSEALGKLLSEIDQIENWCRRVREHAHEEAVHGRVPKGFKLVAKRAIRKWKDEVKTAAVLRALFDLSDEEIFTMKMLSPAAADKLVGKAGAPQIADLYAKESSGTVLAPLLDSREAVKADPSIEFGA